MNQKKILKFEERERKQLNKMDHSLSLEPNSNEIVKQLLLGLPYLSRKFQELSLQNLDIILKCYSNFQTRSLKGMNLPFYINGFKICSKFQNKHMGSFPIKLGSQPYTFYNFWKCLFAPNNCFANYCINRHCIDFIQNANKTF